MSTVVLLSVEGARLYRGSGKRWQKGDAPRPGERIHVVVDTAFESFKAFDLPRVFGADRDALLARRLNEQFPDTPLRTAVPLDPNPLAAQRAHLGVAIGEEAWIETAIAAWQQAGVILVGLWPLGLGLFAAVRKRKPAPFEALVARCDGAFRLLFLVQGRPVLMRRIECEAAQLGEEIFRSRRYLTTQMLLPPDVGPGEALTLGLDETARAALAGSVARVEALDVGEPGETSVISACAEAGLWRLPQLAPPAWRAAEFGWRGRRLAWASLVLAVAGAASFALPDVKAILAAMEQGNRLELEAGREQGEIAELKRRVSAADVDIDVLYAIDALEAHLRSQNRPAQPLLAELSRRLAAAGVGLPAHQVVWRTTPAPCQSGAQDPSAGGAGGGAGAPAGGENMPVEHIELVLRFRPPAQLSPRALRQTAATLQGVLGSLPGLTLLEQPDQRLHSRKLRGQRGKDGATPGSGEESLELVYCLKSAT